MGAKAAIQQNVFGVSEPAPYQTWDQLAEAKGWVGENKPDLEKLKTARDNARRYLDDLAKLLELSFMKLVGVVTALALIYGFGGESIRKENLVSAALTLICVILALIAVLWALAPRFKVWWKNRDIGLAALDVLTIEDEVLDAYKWLWQRYRTWRNIERMFNAVCVLAIGSLLVMAWNVVPWSSLYPSFLFS